MKLLFLDIDTQKDFIEPTGRLYVSGAEEIRNNLKKLYDCVRFQDHYLLSSLDTHTENDPEFKSYKPHCIKGTEGHQKIKETTLKTVAIVNDSLINFFPENRKQFLVEKTTVDIFSNPHTEKLLEFINPDEVIVFGVATDVCIKAAVEGLLVRNYRVTIITDAVKGINESSCKKFFDFAKISKVRLLTTEEAMKGILCESLLLKSTLSLQI